MTDTMTDTMTGTRGDEMGDEAGDRKTGAMIGRIIWSLFLDAGLAVAGYLTAVHLGASLFVALLVGTGVAFVRAAYVIIRRRELDAFAIFMIITFGIGLLLTLFTGSPRFLLAKDSISTGVSGIVFGVTLVVGKPMMYYFAQRFGATSDAEREEWAQLYPTHAGFRSFFRGLTLAWAVAFLVEAALKLVLVLMLPVTTMAPVVPFFTPVLISAMVVWTVRRSVAARRRLSVAR
ncbi:VC0807 family protein [Microlunatus endophyticus]|nr:VC0807 family protein [Microlunatus endophyticus]